MMAIATIILTMMTTTTMMTASMTTTIQELKNDSGTTTRLHMTLVITGIWGSNGNHNNDHHRKDMNLLIIKSVSFPTGTIIVQVIMLLIQVLPDVTIDALHCQKHLPDMIQLWMCPKICHATWFVLLAPVKNMTLHLNQSINLIQILNQLQILEGCMWCLAAETQIQLITIRIQIFQL